MPARKRLEEFTPGRGYTKEDWDEVSDNPELTDEELAQGRPFAEALPELAASIKHMRGKQRTPTKELISLRLDRDILAFYRSTGSGWQGRINEALREKAGLRDKRAE
jgi:uncharacterized protein (DUF4415 family)